MQFLCHYYKDKGDYERASKMAHGLLDYTGTVRVPPPPPFTQCFFFTLLC